MKVVLAALLTLAPTLSYAQNPLAGSVQTGAVSPQPLRLSLSEAVDRGLQYNLAVLSGTQEERAATASHFRALYELYPKVNADVFSGQQQINLAAFGFDGFPGVRQVIGPFALIDARAHVTQTVYDRKLLEDLREARTNEMAVSYANDNTRELVVVTIANLYLQGLAGASRIEAVEAQLARAQTLYQRANDLKNSGMVASIEVLRAQVELQNQQQRLIAVRNEFALQRLNLMRAIGIPLAQEILLTDPMPVETPPLATLDEALNIARESRPDLRRAQALLQSARHALQGAKAESLPSLDFSADYGTIGRGITNNHGSYTMTGRVRIPVFNANHGRTDEQAAAARYEARRLESEDLQGRIEMEVRSAFLDIQSADEQLRVARSSVELARAQLNQAQDRFEAGVANNLEVVQAQESVALGDENVISSLYALNIAKARLARAMGGAERLIKTLLGGSR